MVVDIFNTERKYRTIYIDPPWEEKGGGKIKRGADRHYNLMTLKEIAALPIKQIAAEDGCHLYMWVTNNFLEKAFTLLFGLGQYYRGITEHCIFASTKKRLPYKVIDGKRQQGVTGFYEAKTIHSRKPLKMREMIEKVSYEPRIEIFARQQFNGWDCYGNEAETAKEA